MRIGRAEVVTALPDPDGVELKHGEKEPLDIGCSDVELRISKDQGPSFCRMRYPLRNGRIDQPFFFLTLESVFSLLPLI